jgi:hypothetical protein
MADQDEFSEHDREQLAALGIRPVSPLAVRLWAAGGTILAFDILFSIAYKNWMRWSGQYATHFDPFEVIERLINSDSAVSISAAWVTVQWICMGLVHLNRHHTGGVELLMAALMPALVFFSLAVIGGILMTRFRFVTKVPRSCLRNDFIKSGRWWGGLFAVSISIVLVWYVCLSQGSIWISQLEDRSTPFILPHMLQEQLRSYFRMAGLLLLGSGVLLGGLGQIRFILRYRGRVSYLVKASRD